MMMMNKIGSYLDELFPNPQCELHYNNDYELLIAIVLSAQSTDRRVNVVTPILFNQYSDLVSLKNAKLRDLELIIRPIGSFRKKAVYVKEIARILVDCYNCVVPTDRKELEKLPGVGRKTINVFLSEYYNIPAIAVDTHVERVSKRLGLADINDNVLKIEEKLMEVFPKKEWARRHLQLVLFGRYHCKSLNPKCLDCKLSNICKKNTSSN